mmetsp:Transcript_3879/g.7363  ORF Transcript_3879/g.7363 Transcript_3879/m.7363 type:complete len:195 (-) Transcript_3879:29-613(-)
MRQDLAVQNVRTALTAEVYETHARIALERGDLGEFHRCACVLAELTPEEREREEPRQHQKRKKRKRAAARQIERHRDEFAGYRLLHALVRNERGDVHRELRRARLLRGTGCAHALGVAAALEENNYRRFFALRRDAPHLSGWLMDRLVRRVRKDALPVLMGAYRPRPGAALVREALGFEDDGEAEEFLKEHGNK